MFQIIVAIVALLILLAINAIAILETFVLGLGGLLTLEQ